MAAFMVIDMVLIYETLLGMTVWGRQDALMLRTNTKRANEQIIAE